MAEPEAENNDNYIIVDEDYENAAIEAYCAGTIRLKDPMASLGFSRTHTLRKVKAYKDGGAAAPVPRQRLWHRF
jgi:hypothetical protein